MQKHSAFDVETFEQELGEALAGARMSFDLTSANDVVRRWWLIALGRSRTLSRREIDQVERARRGDLSGLSALGPDGTFRRLS